MWSLKMMRGQGCGLAGLALGMALATGAQAHRDLAVPGRDLDGILILQRMSQLARIKNRAKIRDLERAASS